MNNNTILYILIIVWMVISLDYFDIKYCIIILKNLYMYIFLYQYFFLIFIIIKLLIIK
jgi:hypothetical protein